MITKDKIRGLFIGTAIGDSLGLPVETWSSQKIKETYGRIDKYHRPDGHKWFNGELAGTTTDDTAATLAVAEALIEAGCLDMDIQAKWHIKSLDWAKGWGASTKESILRLKEGSHWKESGKHLEGTGSRGLGNGVAMKCAPLFNVFDFDKLADFTGMTHPTSLAVSSCLAHITAVRYCLITDNFDLELFLSLIHTHSSVGEYYYPNTLDDRISDRLLKLKNIDNTWTDEQISKEFGNGSCYAYNSLPFTYAYFCRNHDNIETVYDCISNGGDTDTNGSMLAGLMGTLHGTKIFPQHLIDGLLEKDKIVDVADRFFEKFKNKIVS